MTPTTFDPGLLVAFVGAPLRVVARRLDVDPAVLCRPLSAAQADRFAVRLGCHPAEIWGVEWWVAGRKAGR